MFALGIPLDRKGPQTGLFGGRFNPIHQMLATGTDAIAGQQDWNKIRYADDTLNLCVQGATHWDALGHIFYEDKCYNGHDAKLINSRGLTVLGIEHSKSRMNGLSVLLDIARFRKVPWLKDGEGISNDELNKCARAQNVEIRKGDFVHRPHRANGALPQGRPVGRLRRRRRTGRDVRELLLVPGETDRRALHGHLGRARYGRTRPRKRTNRGTGSSSRRWACAWARSSISRSSPRTARTDGIYEFFFCGPPGS